MRHQGAAQTARGAPPLRRTPTAHPYAYPKRRHPNGTPLRRASLAWPQRTRNIQRTRNLVDIGPKFGDEDPHGRVETLFRGEVQRCLAVVVARRHISTEAHQQPAHPHTAVSKAKQRQ